MKNKKQHYVPKFILRKFSIEGDGKQIGIYNKRKDIYRPSVALKNQAYENYFYGKNGVIEDYLAEVESKVSSSFSNVIENKALPPLHSEAYNDLRFYTFIQEARTKYAINEKKEIMNNLFYEMAKYNDNLRGVVEKEEPGSFIDPEYVLRKMLKGLYMAEDLSSKLIVNATEEPFLLSDNPVVKNNIFLEKRKHRGGLCGIISKGLQVFFPISPTICLHFYDGDTYRIGNRKDTVIIVSSVADIREINMLQYIYSEENVFFNNELNRRQLSELKERSSDHLIDSKSIIQESKKRQLKDGSKSVIFHGFRNEARPNMNLSFVKLTKKAKKYNLGNWVVVLRKEEWRWNGFLDRLKK